MMEEKSRLKASHPALSCSCKVGDKEHKKRRIVVCVAADANAILLCVCLCVCLSVKQVGGSEVVGGKRTKLCKCPAAIFPDWLCAVSLSRDLNDYHHRRPPPAAGP